MKPASRFRDSAGFRNRQERLQQNGWYAVKIHDNTQGIARQPGCGKALTTNNANIDAVTRDVSRSFNTFNFTLTFFPLIGVYDNY